MGVDQNGRDTKHPDAGPDASAYHEPGHAAPPVKKSHKKVVK